MRPDEAELALRRPDVEPEEAEGNLALVEEMQDESNPISRSSERRSWSTSHDNGRHGRRRMTERREERQNGAGDDPTVGKTDSDQCWGCNVVYDGGGLCVECVTELQEQCVQDDVRLASYVAGTCGA